MKHIKYIKYIVYKVDKVYKVYEVYMCIYKFHECERMKEEDINKLPLIGEPQEHLGNALYTFLHSLQPTR